MAGTRTKIDLDHSKIRPAMHDGIQIPECYEPLSEHIPKVKAMDIREDDVLLCSFPKSGTHWMYRVIDMLQRESTDYYDRTADSTFLEVQRVELMAELTSPRVLVSHLPFHLLPQQAKDKRTKLVHVYRNPRAVLVSYYFMMKTADLSMHPDGFTLDKASALFMSDKMAYSGWFKYMDSVSAYEEANPDHSIFNVSYEDMTLNPLDTVKRLAEYLGKKVSPEFCSHVVEACSFKKQKESEESADKSQASLKFYRKGDMSDWKNYVTVAMDEKIAEVLNTRAEKCRFSAKY